MSEVPPEFEPLPNGEPVPSPVKGGTDFNAPDLSGYPDVKASEDGTEYRDPLGEGESDG